MKNSKKTWDSLVCKNIHQCLHSCLEKNCSVILLFALYCFNFFANSFLLLFRKLTSRNSLSILQESYEKSKELFEDENGDLIRRSCRVFFVFPLHFRYFHRKSAFFVDELRSFCRMFYDSIQQTLSQFSLVCRSHSHLVGPSVNLFDENQSQTGFISDKNKT